MTTGILEIIVPYGQRVSGLQEIASDPGSRIVGQLEVIDDGVRIVGGLAVHIPFKLTTPSLPALAVTESDRTRDGFAGSMPAGALGGTVLAASAPLSYRVRYAAGDVAWELQADFPLTVKPDTITINLGGSPVTFQVQYENARIDNSRQVRTVRATFSIADVVSTQHCLDETALFQEASELASTLLPGLTVSWQAASFTITPPLYLALSDRKTRNELLREILELASADLVLQSDGAILIRDIAPDPAAPAAELQYPILSIKEETPAPVPVTGVLVSIYGDDLNGPRLETAIEDVSTEEAPIIQVKVYAWPGRPEVSGFRQWPSGPDFDPYGPSLDFEVTEEIVDFKNGKALVLPQLTDYDTVSFDPVSGWSKAHNSAVEVIEWQGPDIGPLFPHESGLIVASSPQDSRARLRIARRFHSILVKRSSGGGFGSLPAGWDSDLFPKDQVQAELDISLTDAQSPSIALVRTEASGKIADHPILSPNSALIPYTGQRHLRMLNALSIEVVVAGEAMVMVGQVVDLGQTKMIVDEALFTNDGVTLTTVLKGRVV